MEFNSNHKLQRKNKKFEVYNKQIRSIHFADVTDTKNFWYSILSKFPNKVKVEKRQNVD